MKFANKRDLSISMLRANVIALFTMLPVAVLQFSLYLLLHNTQKMEIIFSPLLTILWGLLFAASIFVHEFIHGLTWVIFGKKSFSAVQFGFQWKTLTPYAHLKEPVDVNLYRLGGFMPGFILGILLFILSLVLGNGYLLWFSILHTATASGDWTILWILRGVKSGTLVEDHPSRAGCYVYES